MVAPEASYEEISGRISQNRDFLFGGKFGWCLLPAQELVLGGGEGGRGGWGGGRSDIGFPGIPSDSIGVLAPPGPPMYISI